jgi:hypothetical protein
MKICLPSLVTAGLFAAILLLDLINREYKLIMGHSLLAFVSILLVLYLCEKTADYVAWALLATPFVLIFLGWSIGALHATSGKKPQAPVQTSTGLAMEQPAMYGYGGCPLCQQYPCTCNQASVQVPTDVSGNQICGPNSSKKQCINTQVLPSA